MRKTVILAAVVILTATCGILLLLYPSREQQAVVDGQEALILDILSQIEENAMPLVYYPDNADNNYPEEYLLTPLVHEPEHEAPSEESTGEPPEPPYEPEHGEYEGFYFEPLSDTIFPSAIQGIGILTIDRINLHLPIAEGVEYATLRIAPGRVPQTAQIGEIGNAVIAGHRNYTHGSMFNRLGELELGDIVGFQARSGEQMLFEVFEIAVIEPHDQMAFIQPVNDSIITLYTCTPIRTATHRLIVRAQRFY